MRYFSVYQPSSLLIGLLSVLIILALAFVFLPIALAVIGLAVFAATVFWGWNWLKVKLGIAKPEPYADWRDMMRRAEEQAREQYCTRQERTSETVYIESDVVVEANVGAESQSNGNAKRRKWKMTDVEDAETK